MPHKEYHIILVFYSGIPGLTACTAFRRGALGFRALPAFDFGVCLMGRGAHGTHNAYSQCVPFAQRDTTYIMTTRSALPRHYTVECLHLLHLVKTNRTWGKTYGNSSESLEPANNCLESISKNLSQWESCLCVCVCAWLYVPSRIG